MRSTQSTPTAKGDSLASLFAGAQSVNHLFIDNTYRASGYYEFDSAQNFASLGKDGNFKVYKELGSYDTGGDRPTLKHGQFFPYNDLEPDIFATINGENLNSATAVELPESDPRKYEQLYLIKDANCYYGMELEASFVQTPSDLDAWGHDIIYGFTGDDDFWLYVDGELIIDLGGIHSAVPGSVNFRTGQVSVNGKNTTLRDLFIKNYKGRGHSEAEAQAHARDIFELNAEGNYVFKDNTTHTMRIFYMERGAGAANLHMRFNLASVKPGTVQLSKELEVRNSDAAFNFRLYLATEFDVALHEMPANTQTYHAKDMDGNYCSWNAAEQKFEKIGSGIQNYANLTAEQKVADSCARSPPPKATSAWFRTSTSP